jgi:hypothetical protein
VGQRHLPLHLGRSKVLLLVDAAADHLLVVQVEEVGLDLLDEALDLLRMSLVDLGFQDLFLSQADFLQKFRMDMHGFGFLPGAFKESLLIIPGFPKVNTNLEPFPGFGL